MNGNNFLPVMPISANDQASLSSLSEILVSDKKLLQETVKQFRPFSENYEDSWGYIIQSTRYGGIKWHNRKSGALIFFGRKSDNDQTLTVTSFFSEPDYLAYVINKMQTALRTSQTVLKNINPEEINKFLPYGFRPYKELEGWGKYRFDDQTYPQQIINLNNLIEPRGKRYHQLKRLLNKKPQISIREYTNQDKKDVLAIFALKDRSQSEVPGMYFVSHAMYPDADLDKFVIIDNKTEQIIGFTATSEISSKNSALVASLFKTGIKVESVWGIYQTLMKTYSKGFKKINLGGCETEGTYTFLKRTFRPSAELEKTHLIYDPI